MPTHVSRALSASPGRQQVNQRELRRVTRRSLRPRKHPQTELSPGEAASIAGLSGQPGTVLSLPAGQHPSPVPLAPYRSETRGTAGPGLGHRLTLGSGFLRAVVTRECVHVCAVWAYVVSVSSLLLTRGHQSC